jgi:hypothetical protein
VTAVSGGAQRSGSPARLRMAQISPASTITRARRAQVRRAVRGRGLSLPDAAAARDAFRWRPASARRSGST